MYHVLRTLFLFGLLEYFVNAVLESHIAPYTVFHNRAVGMTCVCGNDQISTANVTYNISRHLNGGVDIEINTLAVSRMAPGSHFVIQLSNNYFTSPLDIVCTKGDVHYEIIDKETLHPTDIYDPDIYEDYQLRCSIPNNSLDKYARRTISFQFLIEPDKFIYSEQLSMSSSQQNKILMVIKEDEGLPLIYYEYEVGDRVSFNCTTYTTGYYLKFNGTELLGEFISKELVLSASDNDTMVRCSLCAVHCEMALIDEIRVLLRDRTEHYYNSPIATFQTLLLWCSVAVLVIIAALVCVLCCARERRKPRDCQEEYQIFSTKSSKDQDKDTPIYANTTFENWISHSSDTPVMSSEVERDRPPSPIYDYAYCRVQLTPATANYTAPRQNAPYHNAIRASHQYAEIDERFIEKLDKNGPLNTSYNNGARVGLRSSHQYTEIDENFLNEQKARCKR